MVYVLDIGTLHSSQKAKGMIRITIGGKERKVSLTEQQTGFGIRKFFVCPCCGNRRVKLYIYNNNIFCRSCGQYKPYEGIQNSTKGGDVELGYRMSRFGAANGIEVVFPFNYLNFAKDERLKKASFRKKIAILQALENMRFQNIFLKATYPQKVIRAVLNGKHVALDKYSLQTLKEHTINFYEGM